MRRFVLGWKMLGLEQSLGSRIVTYADDLVILCRRGKAEQALQRLRGIMGKLKLTVNEEKTRICRVREEEFDFLGYTFGQMYSENRKSLPGLPAIEEEHQAHGREYPRADRPIGELARDYRAGGQVEPHVTRMGELLRSRHRLGVIRRRPERWKRRVATCISIEPCGRTLVFSRLCANLKGEAQRRGDAGIEASSPMHNSKPRRPPLLREQAFAQSAEPPCTDP
jgi:hypothetical protein